ncbi:hypothetical protein [Paracoccus hibiscisoli]|uniref:Class I SAM-dependent methyltransferase n=1 Tax=Paracoccus hibiscisoli TaxID=2023261 RepID=A0A4U0QW77_9RHOB|nr:hypothetical protein [Paracoccus hibiscisoli]TJZ85812.1 hypothetical protein FA740_05275 [Paracoccus hibiscisoli]
MTVNASASSYFEAISGQGNRPEAAVPLLPDAPVARKPKRDAARRAEDFYPTAQPEAIRALFARDGARIRECGTVWEPACGDGALVREIRAMGMPCCASDLIDRGCPDSWTADFYTCFRSRGRAIITNPPFSEITARDGHGRWLRHTLDMPGWDYLALLLGWEWPAGKINGLGKLMDEQPFSYCYLMRWKLDFTGQGQAPQRNAWFVWDRRDPRGNGLGDPGFRWLDRVDGRQGEMPL